MGCVTDHSMDVHLFWGALRKNAGAQAIAWQAREHGAQQEEGVPPADAAPEPEPDVPSKPELEPA